jgi:hypothetical protein
MAYGLPGVGDPSSSGWAAKLNASITAVKATADAATVRPVPPAAAGTRSKLWDERLSAYNLKASNTRKTRAGLARAKGGTGLWNLATAGDSTTAGFVALGGGADPTAYTHPWPEQVLDLLAARGYPTAGKVTPVYRNAVEDPRDTIGAGWNSGVYKSNLFLNSSTTNAYVITHAEASTKVKVWYMNGGAGQFTVTIDGGAPATVTVSLADNSLSAWTSGTLTSAVHTVSIARVSGSVFLWAVENVQSTTGVRLCNAAISGSVMQYQAGDGPYGFEVTPALAGTFGAHTAIIFTSANDVGIPTSTATYKTQLQQAINNLQTGGADVILGHALPVDPTSGFDVTTYSSAIYDLADTEDIPVLDFTARWNNDWTTMNSAGLMSDSVHGNNAGYADYAAFVLAGLLA